MSSSTALACNIPWLTAKLDPCNIFAGALGDGEFESMRASRSKGNSEAGRLLPASGHECSTSEKGS